MRQTRQSTGGTSFFGTTIVASLEELRQVLGKPIIEENDGRDKVNFEWEMETDSEDMFTVYDWKEYRPLSETEEIEWHIGGFNKSATERAKVEIEEVRLTR